MARLRALQRHVRHECQIPSGIRRPRKGKTWTCHICRRTWTMLSATSAQTTNENEGWISSFTMSYPDGTTEVFSNIRKDR